jgi:hypothetical protein
MAATQRIVPGNFNALYDLPTRAGRGGFAVRAGSRRFVAAGRRRHRSPGGRIHQHARFADGAQGPAASSDTLTGVVESFDAT